MQKMNMYNFLRTCEMNFKFMEIEGLKIFKTNVYTDLRGIFYETFKQSQMENFQNFSPVQSNFSRSKKGTLRGLHFSDRQHPQNKLLTCLSGRILDVVVDLRQESKSFLTVNYIELSAHDGNSILIPHGLGHSFLALEDDSAVQYFLDSEYLPELEFTVSPFSKEFSIDWPNMAYLQSDRDRNSPSWTEFLSAMKSK